ncbi:DUF1073 domain-containing protein [Martelella lutilitoris]|uniref:Anti-CBASS protein Acb1 n=1 Tax=Martelella lutilitoris TaxID=2583532 RepID=A0A7T7HHL7_9HYPH|nr:anti-CBASS Acb1 family protein [Martelella lutilitoris]QQM29305.1 DUF1073 domain-containing protein [Martelella lutilitoris]
MAAKMMSFDGLESMIAGLGDPLRDKMATASYSMNYLDDLQIMALYRSNALARKIIDIPALDSVREGRDWQAKQEQITLIEDEEKRLGYWQKLYEARCKARLWGGAAIFAGTGDQNLEEPLEVDRVKKGGLKYLTVLSCRDMVAGDIDTDPMSENYGKPEYYQVSSTTSLVRIHPSRLSRFIGNERPEPGFTIGANSGWGDSTFEAIYTSLKNKDATSANIASLVFEANIDVIRHPDLMGNLLDPAYEDRLKKRFGLAALLKGINRMLLLDKDEEYDRKQITFATLPDVLDRFMTLLAADADIPATRLYGKSPDGMNATGDGDLRNYYDRLASEQKLIIGPALYRLDECLIRSALGSRPPEVWYTWSPLWQLSDKEKAEIAKAKAETAEIIGRTGWLTSTELRKVASNQMIEDGFYPGLEKAMEENKTDWEKTLGGQSDPSADDPNADPSDDPNQNMADAAPRTLYVRRDVLNADEIIAWAKSQGFKTTLPANDLHVTVTFSRTPVDWMKMGQAWESEIKIGRGGARLMERFGEARVLLFAANELKWRHEWMKEEGASWDHPEYQPHITISYDPDAPDLADVEPYTGEIILGPEIFEEVKEDWHEGIEEA